MRRTFVGVLDSTGSKEVESKEVETLIETRKLEDYFENWNCSGNWSWSWRWSLSGPEKINILN